MARIPTKHVRATIYSPTGEVFTVNENVRRTQLEVSFSCSLTVTPQPNRGVLTILNLPQRLRESLADAITASLDGTNAIINPAFPGNRQQRLTLSSRRAYVIIEAGEDDKIGRVFEGSAEGIDSSWSAGTWSTSILVGDGTATYRGADVVGRWPSGTQLYDVVCAIIERMGIEPSDEFTRPALQAAVGANYRSVLKRPLVITASGPWVLSEIFRLTGAEWWTLFGEFYVSRQGQPIGTRAALIEDGRGGLRTTPRPIDRSARVVAVDYRPDILPGRPVRVRARGIDTTYRCDAVSHVVNNAGGDFATESLLRTIQT